MRGRISGILFLRVLTKVVLKCLRMTYVVSQHVGSFTYSSQSKELYIRVSLF